MAKLQIKVTSEGWEIEVQTNQTDNQASNEVTETVERLARSFLESRHTLEANTGAGFHVHDFDPIAQAHERDRQNNGEAETLTD